MTNGKRESARALLAGGMSSREVARNLGNPFYTTKASGTGLGIAISRSILRAHGGRLAHRPTPGGGATVFFTLPAMPGSEK